MLWARVLWGLDTPVSETLDERVVRLAQELREARQEQRAEVKRVALADLLRDPGVVIKPRLKPGPRPRSKRTNIEELGRINPAGVGLWRFEVEFAGELVLGPKRSSAMEASADRTKWRRAELAKEENARLAPDARLWTDPDCGRQTCLVCKGEGEHRGDECKNCQGEGYRWP